MKPRLFVSYARGDRDKVEGLAADLRAADCEPFFDELLTGGRAWWDQLLTEIEHCDAFLPVLSAPYAESVPCRREAEYAHGLGKPFLPITLESLDPGQFEAYIAESHWISYDSAARGSVFDLMRGLRNLEPCPPLPDPLPARPAIPISYVFQLKARVESEEDLTRTEQIVLLSDLRAYVGGPENATACRLLETFRARRDITVNAANEIDDLLARFAPARLDPGVMAATPATLAVPTAKSEILPPPPLVEPVPVPEPALNPAGAAEPALVEAASVSSSHPGVGDSAAIGSRRTGRESRLRTLIFAFTVAAAVLLLLDLFPHISPFGNFDDGRSVASSGAPYVVRLLAYVAGFAVAALWLTRSKMPGIVLGCAAAAALVPPQTYIFPEMVSVVLHQPSQPGVLLTTLVTLLSLAVIVAVVVPMIGGRQGGSPSLRCGSRRSRTLGVIGALLAVVPSFYFSVGPTQFLWTNLSGFSAVYGVICVGAILLSAIVWISIPLVAGWIGRGPGAAIAEVGAIVIGGSAVAELWAAFSYHQHLNIAFWLEVATAVALAALGWRNTRESRVSNERVEAGSI